MHNFFWKENGSVLKTKEVTGKLKSGDIGEGEEIPAPVINAEDKTIKLADDSGRSYSARMEEFLPGQEAANQEEGKENSKEYIQCISAKGLWFRCTGKNIERVRRQYGTAENMCVVYLLAEWMEAYGRDGELHDARFYFW